MSRHRPSRGTLIGIEGVYDTMSYAQGLKMCMEEANGFVEIIRINCTSPHSYSNLNRDHASLCLNINETLCMYAPRIHAILNERCVVIIANYVRPETFASAGVSEDVINSAYTGMFKPDFTFAIVEEVPDNVNPTERKKHHLDINPRCGLAQVLDKMMSNMTSSKGRIVRTKKPLQEYDDL